MKQTIGPFLCKLYSVSQLPLTHEAPRAPEMVSVVLAFCKDGRQIYTDKVIVPRDSSRSAVFDAAMRKPNLTRLAMGMDASPGVFSMNDKLTIWLRTPVKKTTQTAAKPAQTAPKPAQTAPKPAQTAPKPAQSTTKTAPKPAQSTPVEKKRDKVPEASGFQKAMVLIPSAVVIAAVIGFDLNVSETAKWGIFIATLVANYGIWVGKGSVSLIFADLWIAFIGVASVIGGLAWIYESSGMTFLDTIPDLENLLALFGLLAEFLISGLFIVTMIGFGKCADACGTAARAKRNGKS